MKTKELKELAAHFGDKVYLILGRVSEIGSVKFLDSKGQFSADCADSTETRIFNNFESIKIIATDIFGQKEMIILYDISSKRIWVTDSEEIEEICYWIFRIKR